MVKSPLAVHKDPQYPHHFDPNDVCMERMVKLHNTISGIPGITISGMSHYVTGPILLFFTARDQEGLFFLSWCCDRRYFKYGDKWMIDVSVADVAGDGLLPITYTLNRELKRDEDLLNVSEEIKSLIENINYYFNHENFINGYGINRENFSFKFVGEFKNVKPKKRKNDKSN